MKKTLEQQYKEETGLNAYEPNNMRPSIPEDVYVEWLEDKIEQLPIQDLPNCTRVEVIDKKGRSYVNWKPTNKVRLSMQDDGRTVKIFID